MLSALALPNSAPAADTTIPAKLELGKDLVNESCYGLERHIPNLDPTQRLPLDIYCGDDRTAAGTMWTSTLPIDLPAQDAAPRRQRVETSSLDSAAGRSFAIRLACQPGKWVENPGGAPYLVSNCVIRSSGWPDLTIATAIGNTLYQGEGIAAVLPVLVAAIAARAGAQDKAAKADRAALIHGLEAAAGISENAIFGSSDLSAYDHMTEVARFLDSEQDFAGAERAYRNALTIKAKVLGEDSSALGDVIMNLAIETSNQGRFAEAEALLRRAEPLVQRAVDRADEARLLAYRALNAANQHKFAEALYLARAAQGEIVALDAPSLKPSATARRAASVGRSELALSLYIQAAMALKLGDLASADHTINQALGLLDDIHDAPPWWRAQMLVVQGQVESRKAQAGSAENFYLESLRIRSRLFGKTAPAATANLDLGAFYADQGKYAEALDAYHAAFEIIPKDPAARATLTADNLLPFLISAAVLGERDPAQRAKLDAEAFRNIQLIRSGVLGQTIAKASARLAAGNSSIYELAQEAQKEERDRDLAQIDLANETAKPDDQRDKAREVDLTRRVRDKSERADALERQIETSFPEYARLTQAPVIEAAELQHLLRPDEALVDFLVGSRGAFVLLVRPGSVTVRPIKTDAGELDRSVASLRRGVTYIAGRVPEFNLTVAHALYARLFGGIEAQLQGVDHLVVVSSGALSSLPFSLLVTDVPSGSHDYANAAWLVRRMALSQVPSVQSFAQLRRIATAPSAPEPFIGFGNPSFTGPSAQADDSGLTALLQDCRQGGAMPAALIRALPPLPETADELRRVATLMGAGSDDVVLGAAASEAAVRARQLDRYRVVYFATHGLLPGELRCQSEPGLALSPPEGGTSTSENDGILEASEIAGLKLAANLVVLSACNTAAEPGRFGGEALSGLADSFFYSGARSVLASHWQVPSVETVRLMSELFRRLGPALQAGVAESLRQSELAMIADPKTAHPFYWAAFTLIGDGGKFSGKSVADVAASPTLKERP
jgi:CHAT domain-containing protein